jgi:type IV pilus assembly protein PilA
MKMFSKKRKGFTLVELIIVMVILGALAAIAIPKMGGSTEGATIASIKSDMRMAIAKANEHYSKAMSYTNVPAILGSSVGNGNNLISYAGSAGGVLNVRITRNGGDCANSTIMYDGENYINPNSNTIIQLQDLTCL